MSLSWDPDPVAFRVPIIDRPIVWYGILFALGFFLGYYLVRRLVTDHLNGDRVAATKYTDRLLWLTVIGTVVGARLGHVFFYRWDYFSDHLLEIPMVWMGGLASHGAAIGILIAMVIHRISTRKSYPTINYLSLLDIVVVCVSLIAVFIRVGNFVNQELIGTLTSVPWAVTFGHPADGSMPAPRHPVQLYEALAYAAIFGQLLLLRSVDEIRRRPGCIGGFFIFSCFTARLILETFKERFDGQTGALSTGQLLSIPLVIAGILLFAYSFMRRPQCSSS